MTRTKQVAKKPYTKSLGFNIKLRLNAFSEFIVKNVKVKLYLQNLKQLKTSTQMLTEHNMQSSRTWPKLLQLPWRGDPAPSLLHTLVPSLPEQFPHSLSHQYYPHIPPSASSRQGRKRLQSPEGALDWVSNRDCVQDWALHVGKQTGFLHRAAATQLKLRAILHGPHRGAPWSLGISSPMDRELEDNQEQHPALHRPPWACAIKSLGPA